MDPYLGPQAATYTAPLTGQLDVISSETFREICLSAVSVDEGNISNHPSQLRCFLVCGTRLLHSFTPLGSPGWVVMEITATPLRLCLGTHTPQCDLARIMKRNLLTKCGFLGSLPDMDKSEVVWAALCFFILVLVTHRFLCLHNPVSKLLLVCCLYTVHTYHSVHLNVFSQRFSLLTSIKASAVICFYYQVYFPLIQPVTDGD